MAKKFKAHPFGGIYETENIEYNVGEVLHVVNSGWYRGENANYLPMKPVMSTHAALEESVLTGWKPKSPFIDANTKILTFGSCFAGNIARHLSKSGFSVISNRKEEEEKVFVVACNEGIVNTFTMRQMFEWMYRDKKPTTSSWHDYSANRYDLTDENRLESLKLFEKADVFVITVGLSEVWYDKQTGDVFSRAIPRSEYNSEKHGFRVSTVQENLENLRVVYSIIRKEHPDAKVIVTLSPVPLVATFRPVACVTANAVSKAVLRVAVDELMREFESDKGLYYWPSYEIVMHGFKDSFVDDNRHVKPEVLDYIMHLFQRHYCMGDESDFVRLPALHYAASAATGAIPSRVVQMVERSSQDDMIKMAEQLARGKGYPVAIMILDKLIADHPDNATAKTSRDKIWSNMVRGQARRHGRNKERMADRQRPDRD